MTQSNASKLRPTRTLSQGPNPRATSATTDKFLASSSDSSSLTALSDTESLTNSEKEDATRPSSKKPSRNQSDREGALLRDIHMKEGSGDSSDSDSSEMIREMLVPSLK